VPHGADGLAHGVDPAEPGEQQTTQAGQSGQAEAGPVLLEDRLQLEPLRQARCEGVDLAATTAAEVSP
jgi:hypothetical protein